MSGLSLENRRLLAQRARDSKSRIAQFSAEMPTDWNPTSILNPKTGFPFSDESAWHLIADLLENGHQVEDVVLEKPPGLRAYVMKYKLDEGPEIYIKIHFGARNKIVGRSFHRSYK